MTIMSDMLAEFAKAMEENPSNWWNHFEYDKTSNGWRTPVSAHDACVKLLNGYSIRRRPRTVTRFDRHGEPVELPEPGKGVQVEFYVEGDSWESCQAWMAHFRSLLEANDHD